MHPEDYYTDMVKDISAQMDAEIIAALRGTAKEAEKKKEQPYLIGANPKDDGGGTITGQPLYSGGKLSDSLDHPMHHEEHTVLASYIREMEARMNRLANDMVTLQMQEKKRADAWTRLSGSIEVDVREMKDWVKNLNIQLEDSTTITQKLDDVIIQIADIYEILEEID